MKNILISFLFIIVSQIGYTQGINFQGVARSANGTIIASSNVNLRLSIISKNVDATPEYIETKIVVTNAQGIFTIVVGDATNTAVTGNFKNIVWSDGPKFLKVEMDPAGGTNYLNMGTTQLQNVPYAFYSYGVDATNIKGIVPVKAGGTGLTTLDELKTAMAVDKVNNTLDTDKPISVKVQAAIDSKLSATDTSKYTKKNYTDSALLTKVTTTGNAATATKLATARKINGVNFDGSGDITITTLVDAGTLTGTTLKSTVTTSSLTSVGTLTSAIVDGKVIVGTALAASVSAVLEASSTSQGFLPPRMSKLQRDAIISPIAGLMIWCSNCNRLGELQIYNGETWTLTNGSPSNGVFGLVKIGDNFQGGKLAYILQSGDPGYDANIPHGIIVSLEDLSPGIRWYNGSNIEVGSNKSIIGTGLENTVKIISVQGEDKLSYAAGLARSYNGGGYSDWYLPSLQELSKVLINSQILGIQIQYEGLKNYWSSTEGDFEGSYNAQVNSTFSVTSNYKYKNLLFRVRAIRSF